LHFVAATFVGDAHHDDDSASALGVSAKGAPSARGRSTAACFTERGASGASVSVSAWAPPWPSAVPLRQCDAAPVPGFR
jgi:hypothetical protein